jgi:glycosyltransferase involved in cell wall biosynthesis
VALLVIFVREGAGVLIPPGEPSVLFAAIRNLQRHAEERAGLVECGLARVREDYDISRAAKRYLQELYLPVLETQQR